MGEHAENDPAHCGGVIGGLLALAVIIVVSPNFESLGSYLFVFFVVFHTVPMSA